jgi:hypothetical protein
LNEKGKEEKHKARLVAKGFSQHLDVDYAKTFALVGRLDTIRVVLSISSQNKWPVFKMNVKSSFLNGILEEEVYVNQPPWFEVNIGYVLYSLHD